MKNPVWLRWRWQRLPMALALVVAASTLPFLAGCSSTPSTLLHDIAVLEGDIMDLEARTREVVADGDKGRGSAAASHRFLEQSKAMADLIRVRATSEHQLACLAALDQEYRALLQRPKFVLRSKNTVPLRRALSALVSVRPRYAFYEEFLKAETTTTNTTPDDDWADKQRCREREKERKAREREKNDDKKDKDKDKKDDEDDKKGKK